MKILTPTEIAILDAFARPPGTIGWIDRSRRKSIASLPQTEVSDALQSLVEKDLIAPRSMSDEPPPDDLVRVWIARFELTSRGRELLAEEGPLPPPSGWPDGQAHYGMFRGLIPEIPFEVFKENRREMAGKYGEGWLNE
jgi:hypothetical protein